MPPILERCAAGQNRDFERNAGVRQFICELLTGLMVLASDTFSGSATGTRYLVGINGTINTAGGGASYIPGNAAGSAATGGQYV